MSILIRLLGIVYSVASKKLASRLIKLGGKKIKSTKSKIKPITDSGIKGLEKKTVGVKIPKIAKKTLDKVLPLDVKKTIYGTAGRLSTKPTSGEKVLKTLNKNSRLSGANKLKIAGVSTASAGISGIAVLKDQRKKSKDKDERRKLTKLIDEGLLKIKQDELDALKLKNKKGVKESIRPTSRKFK
tara:strand:- start:65 stop:619 length:555 start_codon:yes stop_codon:yes gene_type:complete